MKVYHLAGQNVPPGWYIAETASAVKFYVEPVAVKMYDKHSLVLRIETTVNKVTFFLHHRKVERRNRTSTVQLAP